jgi:hypothetical protein
MDTGIDGEVQRIQETLYASTQIGRPSCLEPDALKGACPVRQWRDGETHQSEDWKVRPVPTITRKYGTSLDRVAAGIDVLKTPYRAPKANAICERFLGSLRRECLNHFLILVEEHLYRVVKEYTQYFNRARPHQGIEQRIPCRPERLETPLLNATLASQPVLSGLHHDYHWQAAQPVDQRSQPQTFLH